MLSRTLSAKLQQSLSEFPVTALLGPRQVGKTTLAKQVAAGMPPDRVVYLDLELPSDLAKLTEPELYFRAHQKRLVMIDEVQRAPRLFPLLRAVVDMDRRPGRFLLLGSASPELSRFGSESLAGRIIYHELTPFSLAETGNVELARLWTRGGYPPGFLAATDEESLRWREAFIATYLERDIPQLGIRVPATMLRRFWTMIAHHHGNLWNASSIANALGVSSPATSRYLDILCDTFIVRQLAPFSANLKKRLVKSPKVYIRDSGLLHALLGINTMEQLLGHPVVGASWEGMVIEQILAVLPSGIEPYFYRTVAGAEVDLLLVPRGGSPMPVEIKHSLSPKISKGFSSVMDDLKCECGFIVYPGNEAYPLSKTVMALPVTMLDKLLP
ncbi:MAG TPA: ATP-binding protein [Desulfuromonadales bacterium]|nr:ATP-binding protein [Desulfuromonadales bacterium]